MSNKIKTIIPNTNNNLYAMSLNCIGSDNQDIDEQELWKYCLRPIVAFCVEFEEDQYGKINRFAHPVTIDDSVGDEIVIWDDFKKSYTSPFDRSGEGMKQLLEYINGTKLRKHQQRLKNQSNGEQN